MSKFTIKLKNGSTIAVDTEHKLKTCPKFNPTII